MSISYFQFSFFTLQYNIAGIFRHSCQGEWMCMEKGNREHGGKLSICSECIWQSFEQSLCTQTMYMQSCAIGNTNQAQFPSGGLGALFACICLLLEVLTTTEHGGVGFSFLQSCDQVTFCSKFKRHISFCQSITILILLSITNVITWNIAVTASSAYKNNLKGPWFIKRVLK